jgi:hypothetical protein
MAYTTLAASLAVVLLATQAAPNLIRLPVKTGPDRAMVCLKPAGDLARGAVSCHTDDRTRALICQCPQAALPVTAPICAPGDKPAPESAATDSARKAAAAQGSLIGAQINGRSFCVRPSAGYDACMWTNDSCGEINQGPTGWSPQ